jgi:WD repeat-containing protein 48
MRFVKGFCLIRESLFIIIDRVHSAGRDGVIRSWAVGKGQIRYVHSMEHHTDWVNNIVLTCGGKHSE